MARAIRFIHAADLHLDAPFQGIDASAERVGRALIGSTYEALDRIVAACIEHAVDFLLIAGDAFNSRDKSVRAQLRFQAALRRLSDAGIPVLVVQGNHDPADGFSAGLGMPESVHVFSADRVERVVLELEGAAPVAVYGRSYATAAVTENLARGFSRDPADRLAVGVLHANVGGQPGYEPYAPCSLDDLRAARMDYWALGHIHKPVLLSEEPHVRYAGSPQGLNPNEDGPHGCWLITLAADSVVEEFVPTASVIWSRATCDLTGLATIEQARDAMREVCDTARTRASGRPLVVRLDLTGRTAAHIALARGTALADVVADLRDEGLSEEPWVWLDRVRDLTRPELDMATLRLAEDFAGDLIRIADDLAADAGAASAFVAEALGAVEGSLGRREWDAPALLEAARDVCLDRLLAGEDR